MIDPDRAKVGDPVSPFDPDLAEALGRTVIGLDLRDNEALARRLDHRRDTAPYYTDPVNPAEVSANDPPGDVTTDCHAGGHHALDPRKRVGLSWFR
jgi:hypothetical protein